MMAKMFYTLDETKAALGRNEEEIKQLAREGKLREFRDGRRLMFKTDQVEALKSEMGMGGGDNVDLGVSDTGAPIGLAESRGGSASGISLVDTDAGRSGLGIPSPGGVPSPGQKDDTALAADLGLSGSIGGVPSPGRPGSGISLSGSQAGRSGVNLLSADDSIADPMAQTNIAAIDSGEQAGSGSGLLDLTRVSDDTSLGAELLDEIQPGQRSRAGGTGVGSAVAPSPRAATPSRVQQVAPVYVESVDASTSAVGGAALAASLFSIVGMIALAGAVLDVRPSVIRTIVDLQPSNPLMVVGGIGAALVIIFAIVGLVVGKSAR